uniref:NYN domain-containing protein n=3 Tax=Noccaea caerulescens TaxID=107243 RepID=A0A1J3JFD5_NOCCA
MAYRQKFNFGTARTFVFWDTVACPVPEGLDAETVVRNIHLGLCKRGYLHLSKVKVYGNVPEMAAGAFATAGLPMSHVPPGTKGACRKAIFVDFMYELIGRRDAVNTLLICEDISEDEAFEYAFILLRMERNFNFLLARPNKESETKNIYDEPNVWLWSDLSNEPKEEEEEEEEEE